MVVRLRYDYMREWQWKESRLPNGFIITSPYGARAKSKPVEFMYEFKGLAVRSMGDLMNEARIAILRLHSWIAKVLS